MPQVLIIAYGNPLRSDDGVGWRAAEALSRIFSGSDAEILCFHQLGPELAETISRFRHVIFIDAATTDAERAPGEIRIEPIQAPGEDARGPTGFSHRLTPSAVIALATTLYQAKPQAQLATVIGENFEHGESLSPQVRAALAMLVARIEEMVQRFCR